MIIPPKSTDITTYFVLRSSTTHEPKTDVVITDIDLYYIKDRAAISAKVDCSSLAAADSAHSDNSGFHVGKGLYRIDWPDAAFSGAEGTKINLIIECSGCDNSYLEVEIKENFKKADFLGLSD